VSLRSRGAVALASLASTALLASMALLAGCGTGAPRRDGVVLLPARSASGHGWNWTARCQFGPAAAEGCTDAAPVLGSAQISGDEWNLGGAAGAGSLGMAVDSRGRMTISGSFTSAPPCTAASCLAPTASTWVRGYPSVLYGINQCHAGTSPPVSRRLPFPMRLDSIPRLIGVTAYSARTARVTYDVAYDLWLHPSGTSQPCRSEGTLEIMVWTAYDRAALLPAGMQVGTASIPFAVNGVTRPGTQAWNVYASNVDQGGRTAPWGGTVWFVASRPDAVGRGRVSVDLSAVLSAAGLLLHDNYGWPQLASDYWLDTAAFGVEYGPQSSNPADSGPARFSAQISAYCLDPASTLATATCS
jgi:Glycosyl hydrolase family 12